MRRNKLRKTIITFSIVMFVIMLGITYSSFTGELNITGSGVVRNSTWKIKFANLSTVELKGTATEVEAPQITTNETKIGDYSVTVTSPGDSVIYKFDVVNEGDYDAKVGSISIKNPKCNGTGEYATTDATNVCNHLTYTLKYENGNDVSVNDQLEAKHNMRLVLKLSYDSTVQSTELAHDDVSISDLEIEINYVQIDNGKAKVNENDGTTPKTYNAYAVGDTITLHGDNYYVLKESSSTQNYVTLLKAEPLTVSEVNTYGGAGTENNHVNRYNTANGTAINWNSTGYGGMAYYSSPTCSLSGTSGCRTDYNQSEIKYVVDAWTNAKFNTSELALDKKGYKSRLIAIDDIESLGYVKVNDSYPYNSNVPNWVYSTNGDYWYWTMIGHSTINNRVYYVGTLGLIDYTETTLLGYGTVRPIINVYKSAIQS